ncbi:hypothetical protein FRC10_000212 [Ceratobasidium sp. 414]|nr:hypothetical protein FRC10_000212 [Ceratobasidium sp. 414]
MDSRPGHAYQAPSPADSRSPCPALNSAANHGYLPHSGKNISFRQLTRCLGTLYGLSYPLAAALSLGGILLCGSIRNFALDLGALAQHNKIEHDASLVHQDAHDGDHLNVSPPLVDKLVAHSSDGKGLTLADFARARAGREARIPGGKLGKIHEGFAYGETVLAVKVVGDGNQLGVDAVRAWFGEEKLPSGWVPQGKMGLFKLLGLNRTFGQMLDKVKRGEKVE